MKNLLITIAALVLVGCGNPEADRALLRAVSDESIDAMKAAIANGADINVKDKGGATPLDYTLIKNNRLKYLQIPKDNKTNILNQNIANLILKHGGESGAPDSLIVAALVGDITWVSKHLEDGISVNKKIDNKFTPLLVAAKEGHIKIAELLIQQFENLGLEDLTEAQKFVDSTGQIAYGRGEDQRLVLFQKEKMFQQKHTQFKIQAK